ncbi:hypothetical protein OIU77_010292 [Salix suchowensis]|uniref:C2 domain-containing protein n=1 Tax=Salix suchowensis TaxID=1278906 RepID=A0ABQ9A7W5_9ROSI|nr:hypothetical protein OIU77_010292 [Salix suchowensis]
MKATSSFQTLEITVLSCEDLRINGRSVKKNTCVVVRTDPLNFRETTTDTEGGSYPSWDQKLALDMSIRETCITLEVHCRTLSVDRIIGSARMPVNDFMGGYFPQGYLSFLSYRLKDPKGLDNGIINVSGEVGHLAAPGRRQMFDITTCAAIAGNGWKELYDGAVTVIPAVFESNPFVKMLGKLMQSEAADRHTPAEKDGRARKVDSCRVGFRDSH